jgi:hypothetical protein
MTTEIQCILKKVEKQNSYSKLQMLNKTSG